MSWNKGMRRRGFLMMAIFSLAVLAITFSPDIIGYLKSSVQNHIKSEASSVARALTLGLVPTKVRMATAMSDDHGCDCGDDVTANEVVALRFPKQ